ncbi:STAS/SEC14 domain-containing protein [Salipaludibacillus sp. CUR1]|uniref:STAS/SEC14 domain-containing protein n=1 Tax=Salipaludibacillus sp. CUR1 TaxID=2820003 RepID=UPI001E2825FA|nr:STAS/SEC14 domain-containing protein [Salipaludibacillus sp. CUR1]MCE7792897.1 STAS/SEC14 domain-containing protein [Salipaludibacillus sp. CUR1]
MLIKETAHIDHVLEIVVDEKVTKDKVKEVESKFLQLKDKNDKVNLLVDIKDIEGYSMRGMAMDLRAMAKYTKDVDKIALFTNEKWVAQIRRLSRFVPSLNIKQFEHGEREEALNWLER